MANLILSPSGWIYLILSCIRLHNWGPGYRKRFEMIAAEGGDPRPVVRTVVGRVRTTMRNGNGTETRTCVRSMVTGEPRNIPTDTLCKRVSNLNKDVCYYSVLEIVRARLSSNQRCAACMLPIVDRRLTTMFAL